MFESSNSKNSQVANCKQIWLSFKIEDIYGHYEPIFLIAICQKIVFTDFFDELLNTLQFYRKYKV